MTAPTPPEEPWRQRWPDERAAALVAWIERRFPDRNNEVQRRARVRRRVVRLAILAVAAVLLGVLVVVVVLRSRWRLQWAPENAHPWLGDSVLVVAVVGLVVILVAVARSLRRPGLSTFERHAVARLRSGERRELRAEMRRGADAPVEDHWALEVVARIWWLGRWQVVMFTALAVMQMSGVERPLGGVDLAFRAVPLVVLTTVLVTLLPGVLAARAWLRQQPPRSQP